jgi:hypothetical protein
MAYSDYTLQKIENDFGVKNRRKRLFTGVEYDIMPTRELLEILEETEELLIRSEKAKSEWIVVPILRFLRKSNNKFFTIYSGDNLNADTNKGLNGECDFILAKDTGSFEVNVPIIQLVEAKKNDLEIGIPQCAAQMIGARIFNEQRGQDIPVIYGCVTTGDDWVFLKLEGDTIFIDSQKYYLSHIKDILGIFQTIIDYYKSILV